MNIINQYCLTELRDVLANLYEDESSARRIVADVGLNSTRIEFSSRSINNWHAILSEATKSGQLDTLLTIVTKEYKQNQLLQDATQNYLNYRREVKHESLTEQPSKLTRQKVTIILAAITFSVARFLKKDKSIIILIQTVSLLLSILIVQVLTAFSFGGYFYKFNNVIDRERENSIIWGVALLASIFGIAAGILWKHYLHIFRQNILNKLVHKKRQLNAKDQ